MMNFQFGAAEGGTWDISFIGPFIPLAIFAIPVFIFWRARTRIFFLIFSVALFWLVTPVFFQALTFLLVGITFSGFILVLVAFKKGYISKKKAGLIGGSIAGIGGGIFYWLLTSGDGQAETSPGEGPLSLGGNGSLFGGLEIPGLFMLILISVFAVGFFLYQKYEFLDIFAFLEEEEQKEIEEDISSTVDKAIRDLIEGKDIESTIMGCYDQMSLILEEKGIRDEEYMTPREFEESAEENLDVTTSKISRIREIFELAKYSSHKLKERDKEKVIEDLEALRDELG